MKKLLLLLLVLAIPSAAAITCDLDMMLIMDSSGSIDNNELNQMKAAFQTFADVVMTGTQSEVGVVDFDGVAQLILPYSSDLAQVQGAINIPSSGGFTNWEDALEEAHEQFNNRLTVPDVYIFASDGNPNRYGDGPTQASQAVAVSVAVTDANQIKSDGVRIIAVGIGDNLRVSNLQAIASPNSVVISSFDDLATDLENLANELCFGNIYIRKEVDGSPAAGWEFALNNSPVIVGSNPVTDSNGDADFSISITGVADRFGLYEIVQPGYTLANAYCQGDQDGTGVFDGVRGINNIVLRAGDSHQCFFENTLYEYCGDGIVQDPNDDGISEACDGTAGVPPGYNCSSSCELVRIPEVCGDGIVQTPNDNGFDEQCDGSAGVGPGQQCTSGCVLIDNVECASTPQYLLHDGEVLSLSFGDVFNLGSTPLSVFQATSSAPASVSLTTNIAGNSIQAQTSSLQGLASASVTLSESSTGFSLTCPIDFFRVDAACDGANCRSCSTYACLQANNCLAGRVDVFDPSVTTSPTYLASFPNGASYTVSSFSAFDPRYIVTPSSGILQQLYRVDGSTNNIPHGNQDAARIVVDVAGYSNGPVYVCPELRRIHHTVGTPGLGEETDLLVTGSRAITHFFEEGGEVTAVGPYVFTAKVWVR